MKVWQRIFGIFLRYKILQTETSFKMIRGERKFFSPLFCADNINRLNSNKIVYYSILLCLFIEGEVNMKQKQNGSILFVTVMSLFSLIF